MDPKGTQVPWGHLRAGDLRQAPRAHLSDDVYISAAGG